LIAISGVASAMATKRLLEENKIQGTVVLFGTPAEESTSGKITLVKSGEVNKRVDVAMMLVSSIKEEGGGAVN
jgi:metal-dependent amidase/aminoacylase/carboxypeptidase family protein